MPNTRIRWTAVVAIAAAISLSGCTPQDAKPPVSNTPASPIAGSTTSPTPTPTPTPTPSLPATSTPTDARGFATQACQAVAQGFAADRVGAAAASAARASALDPQFAVLATDLAFIRDNPIDPTTGEGPQQTIDDANAVAQECFSRVGVQVSQD